MHYRFPVAVLAALALAACDDDEDTTQPPATQTASVKIVHAIANANGVNVGVGTATNTITGLNFRDIRPTNAAEYLSVPAGATRLRVLAGATAVIDATPTLTANARYTLIAAGNATATAAPLAPAPILLADTSASVSGQVRVRAVHAASAVAGVDIYATATGTQFTASSTAAFTNVPFRGFGVVTVPPGNYRLCVVPTGTRPPTTSATSCAIDLAATGALPAGAVVTVVATDAPTGGALALIATVDRTN
jgi:hypothetical protein